MKVCKIQRGSRSSIDCISSSKESLYTSSDVSRLNIKRGVIKSLWCSVIVLLTRPAAVFDFLSEMS